MTISYEDRTEIPPRPKAPDRGQDQMNVNVRRGGSPEQACRSGLTFRAIVHTPDRCNAPSCNSRRQAYCMLASNPAPFVAREGRLRTTRHLAGPQKRRLALSLWRKAHHNLMDVH